MDLKLNTVAVIGNGIIGHDLMGWTAPAPGIDVPYRGRR